MRPILENRVELRLLELFFILSFFSISYTYNVNILFSVVLLCYLIHQKNKYNITAIFILIVSLALPYLLLGEYRAVYRDLKTGIVFMPLFFLPLLKKSNFKLSSFFHFFMFLNASVVYIDFVLYFTIGKTIGNFTHTGILPRPCGLVEDSNFYCYLTLIYTFFIVQTERRLSKFYLISIFLSGSISAIITFFVLNFIYKKRHKFHWKTWLFGGVLIFSSYVFILLKAEEIIKFIQELDTSPFIKLKLHSMMLRLTVQSDAINYVMENGLIFGAGAGETLNILGRGINLHNGYLQLLFEMGPILFCVCFYMIFLCYKNLGNNFYIPLFFCVFLLGNILEVIYYPLLSFILFISYAKGQHGSIRFGIDRNMYQQQIC